MYLYQKHTRVHSYQNTSPTIHNDDQLFGFNFTKTTTNSGKKIKRLIKVLSIFTLDNFDTQLVVAIISETYADLEEDEIQLNCHLVGNLMTKLNTQTTHI